MKFCWSTLFETGKSFIYEELKVWFWQLNPYFNSFHRIWRPYGWQVSPKMVAKSLAACDSWRLHKENHEAESWACTSLGVEEQLLIFSSCLLSGRVKKLQKFINFCLKVGHSANLKHSKFTRIPWSCDSCETCKISTLWNGNDLRQLSFWYQSLSCRANWFTKGVYIWVTHLHIAVSTITCSLCYT